MNERKGLYFSNRKKEPVSHWARTVWKHYQRQCRCAGVCANAGKTFFPPWIYFLCEAKLTLEVVWLQVCTQCDSSSESKVPSLFPRSSCGSRGDTSVVYLSERYHWLSRHRKFLAPPGVTRMDHTNMFSVDVMQCVFAVSISIPGECTSLPFVFTDGKTLDSVAHADAVWGGVFLWLICELVFQFISSICMKWIIYQHFQQCRTMCASSMVVFPFYKWM